MSKSKFSEEQLIELRKNKFVLSASSKAITYTDEFKLLIIAESRKNKTPRQIFEEADLIQKF